jgi:hypothetical protein
MPQLLADLVRQADDSLMSVTTRPAKVMVQGKGSYL